MAIKIDLTYKKETKTLWWSTDGKNWSPVTKQSPTSMVEKNEEIRWNVVDETIDEIEVIFENDKIIVNPVPGTKKDKAKKVKGDVVEGDNSKYTIQVKPANETNFISFDPDAKACNNPPCM